MSDEIVKNFIEMTVQIHRDFLQAATIDIKSDIDWLLDQAWHQKELSTISTRGHKNKESEIELPSDYEPSRVTKLWLDFSHGELGRTYSQLYEEALNYSRKHCQLLVANLRMIKQQIELLPNAARSAAITRRTMPLIIHEKGESTETFVAKVDDEHLTETLAVLKSDFAAIAPNDVSPGKTLWQVPNASRNAYQTNLDISKSGDATVYWQGKWYKFTGQSADIARVMWELKAEKKLPATNRVIIGEVVSRLPESIVSKAQNIGSTMSKHPAIADGLIHNDDGLWDVRD